MGRRNWMIVNATEAPTIVLIATAAVKRILVIVGVVLGLGAIGLTAAHADYDGYSMWCTDGVGGSEGETDVPNPLVGLSFEAPSGSAGPQYVMVCYSTTPNRSEESEETGGNVSVHNPVAYPPGTVVCRGDRTPQSVVTVDCLTTVTLIDEGNPDTVGTYVSASSQAATIGPVGVGRTGADVNPSMTTNDLPGDGDSTTRLSANAPAACSFFDGAVVTCPGASTLGVITVNEADLPAATPTNSSPPPACTGVDNTCPGVTVRTQDDAAKPTVDVNLGITGVTWDNFVSETCVQVNSTC